MNKAERKEEIEQRKRELRRMNSEDHIDKAEEMIELAERQGMAPAATAIYCGATAHATLAIAKAQQGKHHG